MKKVLVSTLFATATMAISAQSAINAYQLSQSDLRGTARFMSMAGAFTALGGDLSTLNQNPAGIGVYRKSEIGLTVDFNITNSNTSTPIGNFKENKTHVYCNNFGYIGSVGINNDVMRTFNWGASYSRVASFDRTYRIGTNGHSGLTGPKLSTSLTNYIASISDGYSTNELYDPFTNGDNSSNYNPYNNPDVDWLSALAYNSYMINPGVDDGTYYGLWQNNTNGIMAANVRERGYVDEYAIDFGGNVMDVFYWGLGFGITDLSFTQEANYAESLTNANIPNHDATGTVTGSGDFNLYNFQRVTGTGFNFKVGVIVKPVNELRIGFAVHTPTYFSLSQDVYGATDFNYSSGYQNMGADTDPDLGYFDYKLRSPWRMMVGVAGVIGGRGILSVDYERAAYDAMHLSPHGAYFDYSDVNGDIKDYYKGQNTFRIGGELRVTPQFSIRAGYSNVSSAVESAAANGTKEIYTSGTNPAYTFDKETQYVTLGLGYRYQAFYVDAAYVYKRTNSTYHAFTDYKGIKAPEFGFTNTNNNIVVSLGFKF